MASLGHALVSKILGHSVSEKAFRPWWDAFEDFLIYSLVMMGLIVSPTAIINSTPLDCTLCTGNFCHGHFGWDANYTQVEPDFDKWWVKKFCTMTAVDGFILYFPYILLFMALVIVLIERVFIRIFKAGLKLDMFYNLLVKDVNEENVYDPEHQKQTGETDLEHSRIVFEISQSFMNSSSYFYSYVIRTVSEVVVAFVLLIWLAVMGFPSIKNDEVIFCDVHGYFYECAGHPQQFYEYVLIIVFVILLFYLFCCIYNFLWLIFPSLGKLSRVMGIYKRRQIKKSQLNLEIKNTSKKHVILGNLVDLYYKNKDLGLLLDLLAESSGIAPSIRILCLFDINFRQMCQPSNLCVKRNLSENSVEIKFDDSEAIRDIFGEIPKITCIYTAEILPQTKSSKIEVFHFEKLENNILLKTTNEIELQPTLCIRNEKKTKFYDLCEDTEYSVRVSTILNGKHIASNIESIKVCMHEANSLSSLVHN